MKNLDKLILSAISGILAVSSIAATAAPMVQPSNMEKCYGIVKAGLNDCQTATESCAGSSTKDSQRDAFIFLPKGTCAKIVGGHLKMAAKQTTQQQG